MWRPRPAFRGDSHPNARALPVRDGMKTLGTFSACHRARSGWPSTGPCSGSGRWPPSSGHSAPAIPGLNRMDTFPLPLPVKVP